MARTGQSAGVVLLLMICISYSSHNPFCFVKPRVFVGSSSEKIPILELVKKQLDTVCELMLWTNPDAFSLNQSALDSLVKQAKLADFAILIATKDDIVELPSRGITKQVARDNIIFEYGLFLGATSINRAFLLAEEGIDLPSDLNGITVLSYSTNIINYNSIDKRCKQLIDTINAVSARAEIGFVPSTALAIGYFTSYIKRLCEVLENTKQIIWQEEASSIDGFTLHIVLPKEIDEGGVDDFAKRYKLSKKLVPVSTIITDEQRDSAFHLKVELRKKAGTDQIELHIYDIPSTLNTVWEILKIYYPSSQIGPDADRDHLEKRELRNFANVLRHYITKNSWTRDRAIVEEAAVV